MVESQNLPNRIFEAIISDYGRKTRNIGWYLPLRRAQNLPCISAIARPWQIFDNTAYKTQRHCSCVVKIMKKIASMRLFSSCQLYSSYIGLYEFLEVTILKYSWLFRSYLLDENATPCSKPMLLKPDRTSQFNWESDLVLCQSAFENWWV